MREPDSPTPPYVADPRTAASIALGGPLNGERFISVGSAPVTVGGETFYVPHPAPGIADIYTVSLAETEADAMMPRLAENLDRRGGGLPYQPDERRVLEARALAGTVATAAQVGLEAFANHHIDLHLGSNATWKEKDPYRLALAERYSSVLPEVLGRPSPTQLAWWPTFRRINGLAIEVRHPRPGATTQKGLDGERTLSQRLYGGEYRGASRMMAEAFEHFSPSWIPQETRSRLPEPPGGWPPQDSQPEER